MRASYAACLIRQLVFLAILLGGADALSQVGAFCPVANPPDCQDDECKCTANGATIGDPVDIVNGATLIRRKDMSLVGSMSTLKFLRTYTSKQSSWTAWGEVLTGVPRPFGTGSAGAESLRWWHNYFTYVYVLDNANPANTLPIVRNEHGRGIPFGACVGQTGWRAQNGDNTMARERLSCGGSSGHNFIRDDGTRVAYDVKLRLASGGRSLFFPSKIVNRDGITTATITYAYPKDRNDQDVAGCALGDQPDSAPGVPYVRSITNEDGAQIVLAYKNPGGGVGCVLDSLATGHVNLGSVKTVRVQYGYTGADLSSALTPKGTETYTAPLSVIPFAATIAGTQTTAHWYALCDSPSNVIGPTESVTIQWGGNTPATCAATDGTGWYYRTVYSATGTGNNSPSGSLTQRYWAKPTRSYIHGGRRAQQEDQTCNPAGACSLGTVSTGDIGYTTWEKDKRNFYTLHPTRAVAADGGYPIPFEWAGTVRGATSATMPTYPTCNGADCEWYFYNYDGGADMVQRPDRTERTSVLLPDSGMVQDRRLYSPDGGTGSHIKEGYTRALDGGLEHRYVGTFNLTTRSNTGNCLGGSDFRTAEIQGPCDVSAQGFSATNCSGATGISPLTQYQYHPPYASGFSANKLLAILRFPSGCGSPPLMTQFATYDEYGNPISIIDESGVHADLTYEDGRVTSKTVAGLTTTYGYDNGELYWIKYPERNYEVFCHETTGGVPAVPCTAGGSNTWTPLLQYKVKTPEVGGTTNFGATWAEKVAYTYWTDGTVHSETFLGPTGEVRRKRQYSADAHKRPTWEDWGSNSQYKQVRGYDASNNVAAVGLPYNAPLPDFCGGGSTHCAKMENDSLGGVTKLTEYPDPSQPGVDTRFCYDSNGNVAAVTSNASSGWGHTSACVVTGTQGDIDRTTYYEHDDFGNLIRTRQPNMTDSALGVKGGYRYYYDAMGNQTGRASPMQWYYSIVQNTNFDFLGRPTSVVRLTGGVPTTLFSYAYDGTTSPCGTLSYAAGRLSSVTDPTFTTWYSYDALGHITNEIRSRNGTCPGTGDTNPSTTLTYTGNGNLATITYPHGRPVTYTYDTASGANDRVVSVSTKKWNGTAWATMPVLDGVVWEPYGGLRGYMMAFPISRNYATLEYMLGDDASVAPTPSLCPSSVPSPGLSDQTGRVRGLWVSRDRFSPGAGIGDIFKRTYTWKADQVAKTDTCLLGNATAQSEDMGYGSGLTGYDQRLQLKSASVPAFDSSGGFGYQRQYNYDNGGNRTRVQVDPWGAAMTETLVGTRWPDEISTTVSNWTPPTGNQNSYYWDPDGRLWYKAWAPDATGVIYYLQPSFLALGGPGEDTVYHSLSVNGAMWSFWYDYRGRRIQKVDPLQHTDEYFYDGSNQMLEDRGRFDQTTAIPYPIDEYIWLDGRPVAFIRAKFNSSWQRQADLTGTCTRDGENTACGMYFIVTDHIGKPVLTMDSNRRISGVGEYDPYGNVNRVQFWGETLHPYSNNTEQYFGPFHQAPRGLSLQVRAHMTMLDTDGCYGQVNDWVRLENGDNGSPLEGTVYGGAHKGETFTNWVTAPTSGNVRAHFHSDGLNCGAFSGVAMREYEYRRYEVAPVWTPLRFPGQYWDRESDWFENWNRYYDPHIGRYLAPEPRLRDPHHVVKAGRSGEATPAYAYALNNPIRNTDPNGLFVISENVKKECPNYDKALKLALQMAGCSTEGEQNASCQCQQEIKKCELTSSKICVSLQNGRGPRVWDITNNSTDGEHGTILGYTIVRFDKSDCTKSGDPFVRSLAATMLEEALHDIGSEHSSGDCDTLELRKRCFKQ